MTHEITGTEPAPRPEKWLFFALKKHSKSPRFWSFDTQNDTRNDTRDDTRNDKRDDTHFTGLRAFSLPFFRWILGTNWQTHLPSVIRPESAACATSLRSFTAFIPDRTTNQPLAREDRSGPDLARRWTTYFITLQHVAL
jgi:hypothetical protein